MAAALAAKAAKVDPLLLYRDFAEGLGEVLAVLAGGAEKYAAQYRPEKIAQPDYDDPDSPWADGGVPVVPPVEGGE